MSNLHAFERFHMGIALLALSGLINKLPYLGRPQPVMVKRPSGRPHPVWATRPTPCIPLQGHEPGKTVRTAPSLRVLRIHESDQGLACAGRMVISGRMADVCAELDRLAALETRHRAS
ncbi:hypothetical protein B9Z47_04970 [Limnohabitans sp. 2KL-1]|jgi:hypothetical protein|nr:hypothetical protein B9Z47_04970 [Limnohabitans sp. 2KL-1]